MWLFSVTIKIFRNCYHIGIWFLRQPESVLLGHGPSSLALDKPPLAPFRVRAVSASAVWKSHSEVFPLLWHPFISKNFSFYQIHFSSFIFWYSGNNLSQRERYYKNRQETSKFLQCLNMILIKTPKQQMVAIVNALARNIIHLDYSCVIFILQVIVITNMSLPGIISHNEYCQTEVYTPYCQSRE